MAKGLSHFQCSDLFFEIFSLQTIQHHQPQLPCHSPTRLVAFWWQNQHSHKLQLCQQSSPLCNIYSQDHRNSISSLSLVNSSSHIDSKTITKVPGWTLNFKSYIIDENNPFDPGILSSQFLISKIAWSATSNSESTLRSLAISISNWLIELKSNSMQINSDKCQITLDSAVVKELLVFQDFYTWNNSLSLKTVQTS